jgi:outer membrane phospholipase A
LAAAEPESPHQPTADLRQDILPYERMYFALDPGWTTERPLNAKFQLSLAFRIIEVEGIPADYLRDDGYYGGFVQTTVWDLGGSSKPIIDASYIPEIWWHQGLGSTTAIEPGIGHESNGKGDDDSRSLFYGFLRWQQVWRGDSWAIIADPRLRYYRPLLGSRLFSGSRGSLGDLHRLGLS